MSTKSRRKTRTAALNEVTEENENVIKGENVVVQGRKGLNLSDSDDSSDDEGGREKRRRAAEEKLEKKRKTQKKAKTALMSKRGKAAIGMQLASLASIVEEEENLWKKRGGDFEGQIPEVDEASKKKLDSDVADLLSMGERDVTKKDEDSDDEDEGDLIDAGERQSQGEDDRTEGVEVTVALPEKRKAKRKVFDVEAYVKRAIQKARRENQVLLHKAHFLCLLAHLRYLSGMVSACKVSLGCALSVVPKVSDVPAGRDRVIQQLHLFYHACRISVSLCPRLQAHSWQQSDLTKPRLASFVTWFHSAVSKSSNLPMRSDDFPVPLEAHLMNMVAKMKADSDEDMVLLLLTAFRALGWTSRLVLNFAILPLKPPPTDGDPVGLTNQKAKGAPGPKPSTSKSAHAKKKGSCPNSRKGASQEESFVIDQLDGNSTEVEPEGTSGRKSSKSSTREKGTSKRKASCKADGKDVSPPKMSRSSRRNGDEGNNNNDKNASKEPKKNRSGGGGKLSPLKKSSSPSSPTKLSAKALEEAAAHRTSSRPRPVRTVNRRKGSDSEDDFDSTVEAAPTKRQTSTSVAKGKRPLKKSSSLSSPTKLSAKALEEAAARRTSTRPRIARAVRGRRGSNSEDDFDSTVEVAPTKRRTSTSAAKGKQAASRSVRQPAAKTTDYFIEVLVKGEWVCVDAVRAKSDCAADMEQRATKPVLYVLACNADCTVKDVTMRYAKNYMTDARKKRVEQVRQLVHPSCVILVDNRNTEMQ